MADVEDTGRSQLGGLLSRLGGRRTRADLEDTTRADLEDTTRAELDDDGP
jgi:hypothetical protein